MRINVYVIEKRSRDKLYLPLIEHYQRISKPFAKIELFEIFNKDIAKAHDISTQASQNSYTISFNKYLSTGYNISLDPNSRQIDSYEFSELLKDKAVVNLFNLGWEAFWGLERRKRFLGINLFIKVPINSFGVKILTEFVPH